MLLFYLKTSNEKTSWQAELQQWQRRIEELPDDMNELYDFLWELRDFLFREMVQHKRRLYPELFPGNNRTIENNPFNEIIESFNNTNDYFNIKED